VQWLLVPVFFIEWMPLVLHANAFLFLSQVAWNVSTNFSENLQPAALLFSSPPFIFQIFCGSGSGQLICSFMMVRIHQNDH
jgi:hypothetical protein